MSSAHRRGAEGPLCFKPTMGVFRGRAGPRSQCLLVRHAAGVLWEIPAVDDLFRRAFTIVAVFCFAKAIFFSSPSLIVQGLAWMVLLLLTSYWF